MSAFKNVFILGPHARNPGLVLAVVMVTALGGCGGANVTPYGGPVYPVKGQVLLADGKPLKGGKVNFVPKELGAMPATGEIGSDGTFSLKSADSRDGAAPGEYKVRVEASPSLMIQKGKTKLPPFPAIYSDEEGDTGLTATVKSEPTQLEPFKLVPPTAQPKAGRRDRGND